MDISTDDDDAVIFVFVCVDAEADAVTFVGVCTGLGSGAADDDVNDDTVNVFGGPGFVGRDSDADADTDDLAGFDARASADDVAGVNVCNTGLDLRLPASFASFFRLSSFSADADVDADPAAYFDAAVADPGTAAELDAETDPGLGINGQTAPIN